MCNSALLLWHLRIDTFALYCNTLVVLLLYLCGDIPAPHLHYCLTSVVLLWHLQYIILGPQPLYCLTLAVVLPHFGCSIIALWWHYHGTWQSHCFTLVALLTVALYRHRIIA